MSCNIGCVLAVVSKEALPLCRLNDLAIRKSRLLHAVELLNEKILLLTSSLLRGGLPLDAVQPVGRGGGTAELSGLPLLLVR